MIRQLFKTLANILVEILSFILLTLVMVVSCGVLVVTGKFGAFVRK